MASHAYRRATGFTIVELMVALTVGAIALSSLYAVGSASTRHFREQQRISNTQSSLRAAMNQVKHDFARAGYLATPSINVPAERCAQIGPPINSTANVLGNGQLAAVSALFKDVTRPAELDPANLNAWARVDDVILMGNYATSGEYSGVVIDGTRFVVTIPTTTQSFTRDFTHWFAENGRPVGACSPTALAAAFPPNRLVRLHTQAETHLFAQVVGTTCNDPAPTASITLATSVPVSCNVTAGWISPVNTIRYRVVAATGTEASRVGPNDVAVLRRTEVNPANRAAALTVNAAGNVVNADDRVVLDYVVRFDVNFLLRNTATTNQAQLVPATQAEIAANPERIRTAIIELAARTPVHEPLMDVRLGTMRLPPFRVTNTVGSARTRALRAELFLPNIAYKGY